MSTQSTNGAGREPVRLTPYEMVFGHAYFEEDRFAGIREEAETVRADTARPDAFMRLVAVAELLKDLLPEGAGGLELEKHGQLLFQAYNFWSFGRSLWAMDAEVAGELAGPLPDIGSWELTAPHPSGYLQLPRHLFWSRIEEDASPEPVDGFFWTMVGEEDPLRPPYRRLDLLLVLGMRADRPGFSTIAVASEQVARPLGHWADGQARPEGKDFENILPGGELQGWHGLLTEAEALKLLSRVFWYIASRPESVGEPLAPSDAEPASPHELPPSRLPHRRIGKAATNG